MKTKLQRLLTLALCLALLLCALPVRASEEGGQPARMTPAEAKAYAASLFPDVPEDQWYAEPIGYITYYFPDQIINGIKTGDGTLIFDPDRPVTRGEFLKMAVCAAEIFVHFYNYDLDKTRDRIHWAGQYYTKALQDNLLTPNLLSAEDHGEEDVNKQVVATELFPCTKEDMNAVISRYEMAVILSNLCANTLMERSVIATDAWEHIGDYTAIAEKFAAAVEQAFGKGLLVGYDDGAFHGEDSLTRAQAATVIERLLWDRDRLRPDWAEDQPEEVAEPMGSAEFRGYKSFTFWLQDHLDAWGKPDAEARLLIFGDANKTHFYSAADAAPYMEVVSVPIWVVDKWGGKQPSTVSLTVHKLVAQEIRLIFQRIYEDEERFPIYAGWNIGGARFTDTMRHSWGMAIDINALYNCECNFKWGGQTITCGYGWYPYGITSWAGRDLSAYVGSVSEENRIYSITPTGSVVRAFAEYGWGWGGSGSNVVGEGNGWSGKSYDFMHFSVLPSGG